MRDRQRLLRQELGTTLEDPDDFVGKFVANEKFTQVAERRVAVWLAAFRASIRERLECNERDKDMERYLKGLLERVRSKQAVSDEQQIALLGTIAYEARHFAKLPSVQRKTQLLRLIADYYATCPKEFVDDARTIADQLPLAEIESAFMNDEKAKHKAQDALYLCWYAFKPNPTDDDKEKAEDVLNRIVQCFVEGVPRAQSLCGDSNIAELLSFELSTSYPEIFESLRTDIRTGKVPHNFAQHLAAGCQDFDEALQVAQDDALQSAKQLREKSREEEETKKATRKAKTFLQRIRQSNVPAQVTTEARKDAVELQRVDGWKEWRVLGKEYPGTSYASLLEERLDFLGPLKRNCPDVANEVDDALTQFTATTEKPLRVLFGKVRQEEGRKEAEGFESCYNSFYVQETPIDIQMLDDPDAIKCIGVGSVQGCRLFSLDELRDRAGKISQCLGTWSGDVAHEQAYDASKKFDEAWSRKEQELRGKIERCLKIQEEAIQARKRREQASERDHLLAEARRKYVDCTIEAQGKYLMQCYGTGMGIDLSNVGSMTSQTNHGYVGMATTGMGMSMRMEQKLEQRMELLSCDDHIEIETGESPDELQKRLAMVNFVTPHEIAHVVDHKLPSKIKSDVEYFVDERIKKITDELSDESPLYVPVQRMVKEAWIDGLGINMALSFGTADPFAENKEQRLSSVIDGFVAANDIAIGAALAKTQTPKNADTIPDWHCVMLRFLGCAHELSELDINKQNQQSLQRTLASLQETVDVLEERWRQGKKTPLTEPTERENILRYFQEACREGVSIDLMDL